MADRAIVLSKITKLFGSAERAFRKGGEPGAAERADLLARHRADLALNDVDLSVERGMIQVVMGLSGSGKSTLIRHVNRLVEPTSGSIVVEGTDILSLSPAALRRFRRETVSMVFQRFALLPHRTVLENVSYGLKMAGVEAAQTRRRAGSWVERVGLSGNENRYPSQLSGGMQQRVGLARALATDAPIMLMDEAFSALDPLIRTDMQSLLLDLQRELGRTIVFVTHDLDEALRLGDRIAILKDGELVREGTGQDIIIDPGSDYVAAFVGDVDHGRWIEIGTLEPDRRITTDGPALRATTRLRAAARHLSDAGARHALVVDDAGRPLGGLPLETIVAAMSRPSRLERATELRERRIRDG